MSANARRTEDISRAAVNNLERLRGPRDEDISAVIVRLFGEHAANEQIDELLGIVDRE